MIKQLSEKEQAENLRVRFTMTMLAMLIMLLAVISATYAWYVYNTSRHTTKVRMAAGTGINLQISDSYDGDYRSSTMLESFEGQLNPVSTDKISGGFQKVQYFVDGEEGQPPLVASTFIEGRYDAERKDYYKTSLYLRTNGSAADIYLSDISYEDSNINFPISSAIRVGLVVHKPGKDQLPEAEYIFEISDKHIDNPEYNTQKGEAGQVLDSSKRDGSTITPTLYTSDAYCSYDEAAGKVTLKEKEGKISSQKLCQVSGTTSGEPGEAVQIEVYIWLEGCDPDCTLDLAKQQLSKLAISFAGVIQQ